MILRLTRFVAFFLLVVQSSLSFAKHPVQLAIVLDDIGYNKNDLRALKLPLAITFSILPYTPYAKNIADLALKQEREFLLHIPMQAKLNNEKLGKGALMLNMLETEFKDQLTKTLQTLPNASGINNHMGSTLTEHAKQMQWTMDVLYQQGLYFLDSRTTALSIAEEVAKVSGIPTLRRHVFLDNIKTYNAMEKQFQHAVTLGKKNNSVVIIAHPYPETIRFLTNKFKQKNQLVELVPLNNLFSQSERLIMAETRSKWLQVNNTNLIEQTKLTP